MHRYTHLTTEEIDNQGCVIGTTLMNIRCVYRVDGHAFKLRIHIGIHT